MTWTRYLAKKVFGDRLGYVSPEKAKKYMDIARITYFLSAASLVCLAAYGHKETEKKLLQAGKPVADVSPSAEQSAHRAGYENAIIHRYTPEKGWHIVHYNKNEYEQNLAKETYERARKEQQALIDKGEKLPDDAIVLVDVTKQSTS